MFLFSDEVFISFNLFLLFKFKFILDDSLLIFSILISSIFFSFFFWVLVFLLGFIGLKILFPYNNVYMKLFLYVAFVFSYVTLALIAGIDKEYIKINMGVLIFGTIVQSLYILNLCILGTEINVYRYGIYLAILIVLIVINKVLDKKENRKYYLEFIALLTYVFYVLDYKMGLILFGVTIIQYLLWTAYEN